jgi:glutathione synthase/RimK-type ligase-like ATP-grasp enzyme
MNNFNMKIALVTYQSKEEYTSNVPNEDQLLFEYLTKKGLDVTFEIWDDAAVEWSQYNVAVVKSPWDYFNKIEAFYAWLDKMKALNIPLLNNVDTIKWNADKHYLQDIADKGLNVIPSIWIDKNTTINFDSLFAKLNTESIIIKPCVSGAAKNTYAITKANYAEYTNIINTHLQEESYMAQPFMADITEKGEWSCIFFCGQ